MPQYLSPGVYIEELVGPHPIQGVSTSITGMVGVTVRGPTDGKPQLVTNFNDYQRIFGGFLPTADQLALSTWGDRNNLDGGAWWLFPLAVKGFFDNGGQQLYVKRVFAADKSATAKGATASSATFTGGLFAGVTRTAVEGRHEHHRQPPGRHQRRNPDHDPVPRSGRSPVTSNPVDAYTYGATSGTITLHDALDQELRAGRDLVQIKPPDNATTLTVTAIVPGTWGTGYRRAGRARRHHPRAAGRPGRGHAVRHRGWQPDCRPEMPRPSRSPRCQGSTPRLPALPFWVQIGPDLLQGQHGSGLPPASRTTADPDADSSRR